MFVYFLRAGNRGAIKIGIARNVERRMAALQTGNAFELKLLAKIPCQNRSHAEDMERRIHRFYSRQKIRGEWFQGNIDFRKMQGIEDLDMTKSSLNEPRSDYKHIKNAKKLRRAKRLKAIAG